MVEEQRQDKGKFIFQIEFEVDTNQNFCTSKVTQFDLVTMWINLEMGTIIVYIDIYKRMTNQIKKCKKILNAMPLGSTQKCTH